MSGARTTVVGADCAVVGPSVGHGRHRDANGVTNVTRQERQLRRTRRCNGRTARAEAVAIAPAEDIRVGVSDQDPVDAESV